VHVAQFASEAHLTPARFASLAHGTATDSCRTERRPAVADDPAARP
jgi:hypothetical protein